MANFKAWVEETRAGNFLVRHRDQHGKKFTDYSVEKTQKMILNGEEKTGKWLANSLKDQVMRKYFLKETGNFDLTLEIAPFVEDWLQNCRSNNLSWTTVAHYGYSLQALLQEMPIKVIGEITNARIKEWKGVMVKANRAHWTIRGRLADLRSFLSWMKEEGKIAESPFGKKIMPLEKEIEPRYYTTAEFMALDEAAQHYAEKCPSLRAAIHLAHSQGLRLVEVLGDREDRRGVNWEDITWYPDGKADLLLRKEVTKGQKKSRTLRLDPGTLAVLGSRKTGPIVPIERWEFHYWFNLARVWSRINEKLDMHGLRHTFAKNYLQRGQGNLASLKMLMGHSSIQTTQIYAQFEKSYLAEGIERAYERRLEEEALLNQGKIILKENVG